MKIGELPVDGNSYPVKHPALGIGKTVGFPSRYSDFPEVVRVRFDSGVDGSFTTRSLELVKEEGTDE